MRLPSVMMVLLLALAGVAGRSQAPPAAQEPYVSLLDKTLTTHFPLDPKNLEWYFYGQSNEMTCWIYSKDYNINDRLLTVWTRTYDYKDKLLFVNRDKLNRDTKEYISMYVTVYDLYTGEIKYTTPANEIKKEWIPAIPGSLEYGLFEWINIYESYQKVKGNEDAARAAEDAKRKAWESQFTPYKPVKK